jgi:exoribonuclease R
MEEAGGPFVVPGVVRAVDERGLTVELDGFYVRARVPLVNLPRGSWRFSERQHALVMKGGAGCFAAGDRVRVEVGTVDLVTGEVIASPAPG